MNYAVHYSPGRGFALTRDRLTADGARDVFLRGRWVVLKPGDSVLRAPMQNLGALIQQAGVEGQRLELVYHS